MFPKLGDKRHFRVILFDTKEQMHSYREVSVQEKRQQIPPGYYGRKRGYEGIACYRDAMAFDERLDCRGEVHLNKESLSPELVSHEMTHAANYFLMQDRNMKPGSRRWDETLATTVGNLVQQFFVIHARESQ